MTAAVKIRHATASDRNAILTIVADAMGSPEDVALVETTWALSDHLPSLELVATVGDVVVGHVLHAAGRIEGTAVPGLAPLAVAPAHQGAGIGSLLVTRSLELARDAGFPLVIVTGRPSYYARFGFVPASTFGIVPTNPDDFPDLDAFMAASLERRRPLPSGTFAYAWQQMTDEAHP